MEKGKLIGQGRTAEVFQWGEDKILKLFRESVSKKIIEREYEISLNISNQSDLVPKVYNLIEVDNKSGIIYEKIDGITMLQVLLSRPWRVKKEAQRLAELHKSIQQEVNFQLPSYKTLLKDNIARVELLEEDMKKRLCEYIDDLEDASILCHGDFHPDNVLISKNRQVVIDWMTATKGNPLIDVARSSIIFKLSVDNEKSYFKKQIINFIKNRFYLEYIRHYMKITGTKVEQIEQWELPVAAARLTEWLSKDEKDALLNFVKKKMENLK